MADSAGSIPRRRAGLGAFVAGVVTASLVLLGSPADGSTAGGPDGGPDGRTAGPVRETSVTLRADADGTTYARVDLGELITARSRGAVTRSLPVAASSFTMAGLTWRGSAGGIRLRTHGDDGWGPWRQLDPLGDGPDRGAPEGHAGLHGTDLQWTGRSDGAQVEVLRGSPRRPHLTLIGTPSTPSARLPAPERARPAHHRPAHHRAAHHRAAQRRPDLYSRRSWGADPSMRTGRPAYNRTIQQVHVHHTVNSNAYAPSDVPGLLRGIYRYHTQTLGWSDIGYNFLVDRFGRTWVGRAGGAGKAVRGAHTLGFNSTSTGVAVIGDFETARPGRRVVKALVKLAAWKLARYHRNPRARAWVYSHGSDRFAAGRTVHLPVLDGHRDTFRTACPGRYLYDVLPQVRKRARQREKRF